MSNFGFFQLCFKRRVFEKDNRLRKKKIPTEATGSWPFHIDAGGLARPLGEPVSCDQGGGETVELEKQGRSVLQGIFQRSAFQALPEQAEPSLQAEYHETA